MLIAKIKNSLRNLRDHWLFKVFAQFLRHIYLFSPGIIFILIYYFVIIALPLGQDIVMQAGEDFAAMFFTVLSVALWSLFAWFSSRMVADIKSDIHFGEIFNRHIPRLLGYNVPVGLQVAIFHLPSMQMQGAFNPWLLLLCHNLYYLILNSMFRSLRRNLYVIAGAFALAYMAYLLLFVTGWHETGARRHLLYLPLMAALMFILQVLFTRIMVVRRHKLSKGHYTVKHHQRFQKLYVGVAVLTFSLYVWLVFSTTIAEAFGALGCFLLGISILVGVIYFIRYSAIKMRIKLGLLIFAVAYIIGMFCDPYEVEMVEDSPGQYSTRPPLDTALFRWLTHTSRRTQVANGDYPVYMVIADGGASKSGYWVSMVLSKLEEDTTDNIRFSDHLLSLAGASGGSVGNAAFYAMLAGRNKGRQFNMLSESRQFFSGDFLTYTLARYLGSDIYRHIFPAKIVDDRAAALEQSMEKRGESKIISPAFRKTLDSVLVHTGKMPMLLINTTNVQTGRPGVVSSVKTNTNFTSRIDVLQLIDDTSRIQRTQANIRMSTAVILGARFPYLSPAGHINGNYFVDGGYFDNSGAGITLEILEHIERKILDTTDTILRPLLKKLKFKILYISNGKLIADNQKKVHPLANDLAAPLLTLGSTYGEQTNLSNLRLKNFMACKTFCKQQDFPLLNLPMTTTDMQPYPMNWVISAYNLNRMENNLANVIVGTVLKIP
jgi:hypothetical protein